MKIHKIILIGIVFALAIGLAAVPRGSFACYTGPQYQTDCCDVGSFENEMGNFCCESFDDCLNGTYENCRLNIPYRIFVPCPDAPPPECIFGLILNDEKIDTLRRFRDEVLSQTPLGQEYITLYYEWSPAISMAMEEDDGFKEEVKALIDAILPMIEKAME